MMSNILAMFDIGPPLDATGKPHVIGDIRFTDGLTRFVASPTYLVYMQTVPFYVEATQRHLNAPFVHGMQAVERLSKASTSTIPFDGNRILRIYRHLVKVRHQCNQQTGAVPANVNAIGRNDIRPSCSHQVSFLLPIRGLHKSQKRIRLGI